MGQNIKNLIYFFETTRKEIGFQDNFSNISFDNRSKKYNKEIAEKRKFHYNILRHKYNETKDIRLLYLLIIYSFSHQIRFNKKDEFNMPVGNGNFSDKLIEYITKFNEFLTNNNVYITNKDFRELKIEKLNKLDFLYRFL